VRAGWGRTSIECALWSAIKRAKLRYEMLTDATLRDRPWYMQDCLPFELVNLSLSLSLCLFLSLFINGRRSKSGPPNVRQTKSGIIPVHVHSSSSPLPKL
jgi:hypothetical protein